MSENLIKQNDDSGYIIAWKTKQGFETGKLDSEMTYGEAVKKCEELIGKDPEKTYWPEKTSKEEGFKFP